MPGFKGKLGYRSQESDSFEHAEGCPPVEKTGKRKKTSTAICPRTRYRLVWRSTCCFPTDDQQVCSLGAARNTRGMGSLSILRSSSEFEHLTLQS